MRVRRYKRGDKHPTNAGLFFLEYSHGKEKWVDELTLREKRKHHGDRQRTPEAKARLAAYYKKPEVVERRKAQHNSKPEVVARRIAREKWRAERKAYRQSEQGKAEIRERVRAYENKKRRTDAQFKIAKNARDCIRNALEHQSARKDGRTFELIGCSAQALRVHLQAQFKEGMTWELFLQGKIHIDHKLPIALFDLRDPSQQKICFHFENLQPMWAHENQIKSDKLPDGTSVRTIRSNIIPFQKTA